MKEIGEKLKTSREEAGLSLDEAAEDLKFDMKKLQAVEDGNKTIFKDIYDLKYHIKDYAKYLGLDYEQIEEDFNEFLFDYTSRIPVIDIEKANKEKSNEKKKIVSPYTIEHNNKNRKLIFLIVVLVILILLGIVFLIFIL